jgi:hypothetical protein
MSVIILGYVAGNAIGAAAAGASIPQIIAGAVAFIFVDHGVRGSWRDHGVGLVD